uniref:Uncharacterized protein n=1 Tax=Physcomitrium patens TaxID=3218 RepID=A0A2K1KUB0_PHYPA|nr:hypothetical protein PHYPA_004353 [Physcomitrium patens]
MALTAEKGQGRFHVPMGDRTAGEPRLYIIVVHRPPLKTLEFLNVLQIHGIPKVMEVLTLMDKFEDAKRL